MRQAINTCSYSYYTGGRDNSKVQHRPPDRKVAGSIPGRSGGRIFFTRRSGLLCTPMPSRFSNGQKTKQLQLHR